MEALIHKTKNRFIITIVLLVVAVTAASWGTLEFYNNRQVAQPANAHSVHSSAEGNQALTEYIQQEKDFEAHFVSLASAVREQDAQEISKGLAIVSTVIVILGAAVAYFVAKHLLKPVREAYESQERFIQDAAHELRNPLAAMTAALQKTNKKSSDPLIQTFRRQTNRLISINEDLIFLERQSSHEPTMIHLDNLLLDVIEEIQPIAIKRNITIISSVDSDVTKKMAPNDYVRLAKNLIDNAVKYSPDGASVTIHQHKVKNSLVLTVADKGLGIPKAELEHVGERFFRASNTGNIDGTGLGLAIVQKILNLYGGSMDVTSTKRSGTSFVIKLPA